MIYLNWITLIALLVAACILAIDRIANIFSRLTNKNEARELEKKIDKIIEDKDIESLMIKNVVELREYYIISKRHANKMFWVALISCLSGIGIFGFGVWVNYQTDNNILGWTTMAGAIVELISGLSFFLYKITLNQLNIYHNRLESTERYLIALEMVEKTNDNKKKDELYQKMMECVLIDNRIHKENDSK